MKTKLTPELITTLTAIQEGHPWEFQNMLKKWYGSEHIHMPALSAAKFYPIRLAGGVTPPTLWVPLSERRPTAADADINGEVLCWNILKGVNPRVIFRAWDDILDTSTHWRRCPAGPVVEQTAPRMSEEEEATIYAATCGSCGATMGMESDGTIPQCGQCVRTAYNSASVVEPTPCGPEDFPPGTVIRFEKEPDSVWRAILAVYVDHIVVWSPFSPGQKELFYTVNMEDTWRKLPGTTQWIPCHR